MTTMRAALDERFSDPGTQALPWADVEDVLTSAELFWVTTVRADNRPHQTPLVAVWLDGWLHFSTGSGEQKAYNLAHNDQVLLTTGCNTWDRGVDVVVEGRAERVDDRALLERLATAWADKWDGRWHYEVDGEGLRHTARGTAWVYRVKPAKVLAFTKGTFTHTSYVPADT